MINAVDAMTERWLDEAGIAEGTRVIDMGCGPGTVSLMLARRVGPSGHVCAVDREERMLTLARMRATDSGCANMVCVHGGFDASLPQQGAYDAAVGRRVLLYQADPAEAIRQLARAVRPGGLVWFHEHDTVQVSDERTALPLHDRVRAWLHDMLQAEHAHLHMGFDLHTVLSSAGLNVEQVRAEANVLTPTTRYPLADIVRAVLPRLLQHRIVTAEEVDVDTLDDRLQRERLATGATVLWEMVFCAWARKPF
jgi:ubiquinone/menaquinone biosynthesis C-methylase UbiE